MNNDKFRAGMKRSIQKSKDKTELYFKKLAIDISSAIINKTPVDKGQLHWNWFVGNGSVNTATSEHAGNDKGGASLRNALEVDSLKVNGQTIYITNSLPYAHKIEYSAVGDGGSIQAPAGMVRVTLAELNSISSKVAFEVKGFS